MMRTSTMEPATDVIDWRWYRYGKSTRYPDAYVVQNRATGHAIRCSSENAALKIIELAFALKTGQAKPLNHKTLEQKAYWLENIPMHAERYFTWNGRTLTYETSHVDCRPVSRGGTGC